MRVIVVVIGAAFAFGALLLAALRCFPPAGIMAVWAVILLGGVAGERWRYRRLDTQAPGPDWQLTGERFVDPETGRLVRVYVRPATGERRYVTA